MSEEQQIIQVEQEEGCPDLEGKYLTFRLGQEIYGLEILKVREIIGLMDVTEVPRTPSYVRGVINLRGKIIPVVDLRSKFGMEEVEDTELTCIVVVDVPYYSETILMATLVDTVSEVLDIDGKSIEPPPAFGDSVETSYIVGIAKRKNDVTILLNIDEVMRTSGIAQLMEGDASESQETEAVAA